MTLAELLVKIKAEDKASPTIADLGKKLADLNILGIASVGVIGGSLVAAFGACVKAAAEAETATSKLSLVIKATGGVSGVTAQAAEKLAESLQEVTAFDKNAIISGETLLLTFRNIGEKVFPKATESMLDFAYIMQTDVKSAAMAIGKALDNPTEGMGALQKAGVKLTTTQKEQVDQFMALGNVAKAQEIVLSALTAKMGGAARTEAETYAGRLKQLNNAFGDLKESIGNVFLGGSGEGLIGLTNFIKALNEIPILYARIQVALAQLNTFTAVGHRENVIAIRKEIEARENLNRAMGIGKVPTKGGGFIPSTDKIKEQEEANKKLEKIIQDFEIKKAQLAKDGLAQIKIEEQRSQQELIDTKLAQTKKGEDAKLTITKYYADLRKQYEIQTNTEIAKTAVQYMSQTVGQLSAIFNQYMTNKTMELDNERTVGNERIQNEYEVEKARIENTVLDEREKARQLKALDEKKARDEDKLNKDMDRKKRKMVHDAAVYQKEISMAQVAINTAMAIMQAVATSGNIYAGIALGIIMAALGAAQMELIRQQPLPPAKYGGVFDRPYIGGEAGAEMAVPLTGSQGQTAIQALASGMLDVMSQAIDTRATVSSAGAGTSAGGGGDVYLDGALVGAWLSKGSNNGMFSINKKVVVS